MVEQRIIDSSELSAQIARLLLSRFFVFAVWLMGRSEFAGRIERKTRSGNWVRVWAITFAKFHVQHVCFMLIFLNVWQTTLHWIILLVNNLMKWKIYEFPILKPRNEEINANKIIAFKTQLVTFEGAYFFFYESVLLPQETSESAHWNRILLEIALQSRISWIRRV